MEAWSIINTIPSPSHLSRGEEVGLKVPSFGSWLIVLVTCPRPEVARRAPEVASLEQRMPVTQEIPRQLGALRQKPEAETTIYLLLYHVPILKSGRYFPLPPRSDPFTLYRSLPPSLSRWLQRLAPRVRRSSFQPGQGLSRPLVQPQGQLAPRPGGLGGAGRSGWPIS